MAPSSKKFLAEISVSLAIWLLTFFVIQWLVECGFWLHFFLTSALSVKNVYSKITDLKKELDELDTKISIADQELVRV
jgi:hypothetical protein